MSIQVFRGLDSGGFWHKGGFSIHPDTNRGFIIAMDYGAIRGRIMALMPYVFEVKPETVGQFTGLYDATLWDELSPEDKEKHPKETWEGWPIYEGDILEAHYDDKYPENATRTVVVWGEGYDDSQGIGWYMEQKPYHPDPFGAADAKRNRVIGNIHQNPNLLKGEWK